MANTDMAIPCTGTTAACRRWVACGEGPARIMVYATFALDERNAAVTRALVLVHGSLRNADHYFRTATAAGFLAGALDDTVIIAPRFITRDDKRHRHELFWPEGDAGWRDGGNSASSPTLTSFDVLDGLVGRLADKKTFPRLTRIVIAGHSAGGQFVARYAMANKLDGTLPGVALGYVVANPSTYTWPTAIRPLPVAGANPADGYREAVVEGDKVNTNFKYGRFHRAKAPDYNRWPMGLQNVKGYAAHASARQLRNQLAQRPTTYLLGQVDVLPLGGFDTSPAAMAQGPTRRARGEAFVKYVRETLHANARILIVRGSAHNARCMFTSDEVLPSIFPDG